ncbi:hypothetical protein BFL43_09285 [Williamsia sp. 1135]|nr:hypothetical protein BFL43_09285 [Williamsia sp. 1135]
MRSLYDDSYSVSVLDDDYASLGYEVVYLPHKSTQLLEIRHTSPQCTACAADIAHFRAYQDLHAPAWDLLFEQCNGQVHQLQRGYGCTWAVIDWAALVAARPDLLVAADTTVSLEAFVRAFEVLHSSAPWATLSIELWCRGDGRIEVEPTVLSVHSDQDGVSVPDDIAAQCTHILHRTGWTGQVRSNPCGDTWWTVC